MSKTTDAFIEHENVVGRLIDLAEAAEDSNDSSTAFDIWRGIELIEDLQGYHDDIRAENSMLIDALANYEREEYVLLCANSELRARLAELDAKEAAREMAADADARAALGSKP